MNGGSVRRGGLLWMANPIFPGETGGREHRKIANEVGRRWYGRGCQYPLAKKKHVSRVSWGWVS
jgi:hypothetical protein